MHNRNHQRDNRMIDAARINGAVDIAKDAVSSARIWMLVSDLRRENTDVAGEIATQLSIADEAMKRALSASQAMVERELLSRP